MRSYAQKLNSGIDDLSDASIRDFCYNFKEHICLNHDLQNKQAELLNYFNICSFLQLFFALFHSCYSHAQALWTSSVHVFHIFCTEGGWMICHFSIVKVRFGFLLIEFQCTFYISYKILPYFIYYYCILIF